MNPLQYNEYLKKFWEQRRLEEYQQNRVLPKPKTTKLTVIFYSLLLFLLLGIVFVFFPYFNLLLKIVVSVTYITTVIETYGRFLAIKMIECYQHYASEEKRRSCKCVPSCSEYAVICLKKYELVYALLKIRKRLFVTCKGFDYIIDNP